MKSASGFRHSQATVRNFDDGLTAPSSRPVIDLSALSFVDVYGLVGLACLVAYGDNASSPCRITPPTNHSVANYLARMNFQAVTSELWCQYEADLPDVWHFDQRQALVELRRFASAADVDSISELVWQRLDGRVSAQSLTAVDVGLGELADNVRYHSGLGYGFLAAQVYQGGTASERVQFAIGDAGVGIAAGLALHQPRDDAHAIQLALMRDVSGIDDPGRGQGLPTTVEVTLGLRGSMIVRSGAARHVLLPTGAVVERVTAMPGTIVGFTIPRYPGGRMGTEKAR